MVKSAAYCKTRNGLRNGLIVARFCYSPGMDYGMDPLSLDSAIHLIGPFLRYYTCDRLQQLPPMRNAFTVLMSSQRQLSLPGLPAPVTVRTKKDKLYSVLCTFSFVLHSHMFMCVWLFLKFCLLWYCGFVTKCVYDCSATGIFVVMFTKWNNDIMT